MENVMKLRDCGVIIIVTTVVLIAGSIVAKVFLKDDNLAKEILEEVSELGDN